MFSDTSFFAENNPQVGNCNPLGNLKLVTPARHFAPWNNDAFPPTKRALGFPDDPYPGAWVGASFLAISSQMTSFSMPEEVLNLETYCQHFLLGFDPSFVVVSITI